MGIIAHSDISWDKLEPQIKHYTKQKLDIIICLLHKGQSCLLIRTQEGASAIEEYSHSRAFMFLVIIFLPHRFDQKPWEKNFSSCWLLSLYCARIWAGMRIIQLQIPGTVLGISLVTRILR